MSEQISFSRDKGFVALPVGVLDMDLSPGAFRTLVELCRMANTEGFCWPSLTQLSERLGRSKSTISGYLKDLRAAALIVTEEQRTANGYNYRLKYQVTFWAEWRASLANQPARKTKRGVRPDERNSEVKNQSHKNHVQGEEIDGLLNEWAECFGKAPYPQAEYCPKEDLLQASLKAVGADREEKLAISADIARALQAMFGKLRIQTDPVGMHVAKKRLASLGLSEGELDLLLEKISDSWPNHWRKMPSDTQLQRLIEKARVTPRSKKIALLKSHVGRWRMAQRSLRKPAASCSVSALTTPGQLVS